MALAIDPSTPAKVSSATANAITTASFTPPTGALLVVLYGCNDPSGAADTSITSITNTATGLTWARRGRKNLSASSTGGAGRPGGAEIWTAVMGATEAITVTINGYGVSTGHDKFGKVMVLTGADTASLANVAASSSSSGLPSVTVTGCTIGSYVLAASSDWSAGGNCTVGTAQSLIDEYHNTGQVSAHAWRTTSTLAGSGSQTMNLTAPSAQDYNLVALEILATGGAAATSVPGRRRPQTGALLQL